VTHPEVSNRMHSQNRKAAVRLSPTEEDEKSLKAYRELAKELNILFAHRFDGAEIFAEKAVNRSF